MQNIYTRLINRNHPLPPDYVPENLVDIGIPFDTRPGDPKRLLEKKTAHAALCLIMQLAKKDYAFMESPDIVLISASRSFTQAIPMLPSLAPVSTRADWHWMFPVLPLAWN